MAIICKQTYIHTHQVWHQQLSTRGLLHLYKIPLSESGNDSRTHRFGFGCVLRQTLINAAAKFVVVFIIDVF